MLEIKPQILSSVPEKNCCGLVFLRTAICVASKKVKGGFLFDCPSLNEKIIKIVANFYPNVVCKKVGQKLSLTGNTFNLEADLDEEHLFNINQYEQCCKQTLLKTLFLLNGNLYFVEDTSANSKGYNLEFVCKQNTYPACKTLLEEFGFELKTTKRQNNQIIYTKNSNIICDLLVALGAVYASFEVQNSLALREMRNNSNRQNNCFENNINKTLVASEMQLEAINYFMKNKMLDNLEENLKEIALVRLANPDVSLNELRQLLNNKISRAGIKYRLDKIIKIYQDIKGEKQ